MGFLLLGGGLISLLYIRIQIGCGFSPDVGSTPELQMHNCDFNPEPWYLSIAILFVYVFYSVYRILNFKK